MLIAINRNRTVNGNRKRDTEVHKPKKKKPSLCGCVFAYRVKIMNM
jgi:hypothetical protein